MVNLNVRHRLGYPRNLLFITVAIVALVTILNWAGLLRIAELKSLDLRFKLRGHLEPASEIVVVAIDDLTFAELGMDWPLPRSLHAQIITQLQSDGAKFVGIVFPLPESAKNSAEDAFLIRSLAKAGRVWLPEEFSETRDPFFTMQSLLEPAPVFREAAAGVAFVNLIRDEDGFVRQLSLVKSYQEKLHYHMATAAYFNLEKWLPEPDPPTLFINYAGPPRTYRTVSYYQVLEGLLPAHFFENKVVLIGLNSANLGDSFPTSFSGQEPMSRVEIIANGLGTLLAQNQIEPIDLPVSILLTILVAAMVATTTSTQPLFRGSFLVVLSAGVYFLVAFLLFVKQQMWLPVAFPLVTLVLTYGSITLYRYSLEQRQKRELRRLFSRYVSKEVVEDILQQSDAQMLGGKRHELTVLFSDIRGFTALSQKLAPERVVTTLNQYLSAMTEVIFLNKGTIDKFIGDGIMVMFGAPLQLTDAPFRALNTAIQMQQKMRELDVIWEGEGLGRLQMGIGIHTGDAVIGNIGSPQRMNYTAIGDTVNIASRLQELTKTYDYNIILSESTYQRIQQPFEIKPLGPVVLRGRNEPIGVYGVVLPDAK